MIRFKYTVTIALTLFCAIFFGAFYYSQKALISFVFAIFAAALSYELLLRYWFKIKRLPVTDKNEFIPFIQGHPYLPFVYKPNTAVPTLPEHTYEFMQKDYSFPHVETNNRGYLNGENGDRFVEIEKQKGVTRVTILGDSVAANYVRHKKTNFNFAVEIGRQLLTATDKKIEVNNCAIGGYTTLDILIKFLIKDIHEKPDFIVINHGYSNIRSFLTNNYSPDNSHFRKSFAIGDFRYKIASFIPFKNSAIYKTVFSPWLPINLKDYLKFISLKSFNIEANYSDGLKYFEQNLKNLIAIAKFNNIEVVLCTCPHYLHKDIAQSKSYQKFHEVMRIQNDIIRKIAITMTIAIVDNERILQPSAENFIDSIHLSPIGMQITACGVAEVLANKIKEINRS